MPNLSRKNYPALSVRKSPIHGNGLFADQTIRAGQIIGYFKTKTANEEDGPYVLWINNKKPVEVTCNLKYINHSDRPNCAYYADGSVVALKKIRKNTELTHKYS